MISKSCVHLSKYLSENGLAVYGTLHAFYVSCIAKNCTELKVRDCICAECKKISTRVHACLHCPYFGCYHGNDIQKHARSMEHPLAIDTESGDVYCSSCEDYVHDPKVEDISRASKKLACKNRGHVAFYPWEPDEEIIKISKNSNTKKKINDFFGLRGLINLGNTCFMNCVIQALVHTPVFCDYFLSGGHQCHFQESSAPCLVCEMINVFQEVYSGEKMAYAPAKLLYLIWSDAKHLAGFEQQDAHEFLSTILDILHLHFIGKRAPDASSNTLHCSCYIDQIFTGYFQSDVICLQCDAISSKTEAFRHISLDLGVTVSTENNSEQPVSLQDCLYRYTQPEPIDLICSECSSHKSKQLTIRTLPIVLIFHLKRSDIETIESNKKKIVERLNIQRKNSTFIQFPETLEMSSYGTGRRSVFNSASVASQSSHADQSALYKSTKTYRLYSVIYHIGDQVGGHYISFIRHHNRNWYQCDDALIYKANLADVLACEGYLLFYHKEQLEYQSAKKI